MKSPRDWTDREIYDLLSQRIDCEWSALGGPERRQVMDATLEAARRWRADYAMRMLFDEEEL